MSSIFFNKLLPNNVRPRLQHTYMYAQPSCRSINFNSTPSNITVALPNLVVSMGARSSLDRQFASLSEPNSHRTHTEHVQDERCFFGQKQTCNCNANDLMSLTIRPLPELLGAEITGISLGDAVSDVEFASIRRALEERQVVIFRDQHITPE